MVNTVVTKFNSQLPDATITADNVDRACDSRTVTLHYTIHNDNSTDVLPAPVPIAFYVDGQLIGTAQTAADIAMGGSEEGEIILTLPGDQPHVDVTMAVDDDGTGHGHVIELSESNNLSSVGIDLLIPPVYNQVPPRVSCNLGLGRAHFDFSDYEDLIKTDPSHTVTFYESAENAANAINPILNTADYTADTTPHQVFARVDDGTCQSVMSFLLLSRNCPPTVYNYVSANGDGKNDTFHIDGLYDIFLNFQLSVYNRWGQQVWTGNNQSEEWSGQVTKGIRIGNRNAPDGTYYYLLQLNDIDYPQPLTGFLYLNH
jgi:gliding motility-associated-like protein